MYMNFFPGWGLLWCLCSGGLWRASPKVQGSHVCTCSGCEREAGPALGPCTATSLSALVIPPAPLLWVWAHAGTLNRWPPASLGSQWLGLITEKGFTLLFNAAFISPSKGVCSWFIHRSSQMIHALEASNWEDSCRSSSEHHLCPSPTRQPLGQEQWNSLSYVSIFLGLICLFKFTIPKLPLLYILPWPDLDESIQG